MDETTLALDQMRSRLAAQFLAIQAILLALGRTGVLRPKEIGALKAEALEQATLLRWTGSNPADGIRTAEAIEELFSFLDR